MIKQDIEKNSTEYVKSFFNSTYWDFLTKTSVASDSFNIFLHKFVQTLAQLFSRKNLKLKQRI